MSNRALSLSLSLSLSAYPIISLRYDEDVARRKPPADDPKTDFSRPLPQHEYPLRTSLMDRTA